MDKKKLVLLAGVSAVAVMWGVSASANPFSNAHKFNLQNQNSASAVSLTALGQDFTNNLSFGNSGSAGTFDIHHGTGDVNFAGSNVMDNQAVNVNNINTGLLAGQQGGISIAGSIVNGGFNTT